MKTAAIITILITITCLAGILLLIYGNQHNWWDNQKIENEAQINFSTISITTNDKYTQEALQGTYTIEFINNSKTQKGVFVRGYNTFLFPNNTTVIMHFASNGYYNIKKVKYVYENDTTTMPLLKIDTNPTITQTGQTRLEQYQTTKQQVILQTHENMIFRDPYVCLMWTFGIRHAIIEGLQEKSVPSRIANQVDVCYRIEHSIISNTNNATINLSITSNIIEKNDYVKVLFVDTDDCEINNQWKDYCAEDSNGNDVGAPDVSLIIT